MLFSRGACLCLGVAVLEQISRRGDRHRRRRPDGENAGRKGGDHPPYAHPTALTSTRTRFKMKPCVAGPRWGAYLVVLGGPGALGLLVLGARGQSPTTKRCLLKRLNRRAGGRFTPVPSRAHRCAPARRQRLGDTSVPPYRVSSGRARADDRR